MSSPGTRTRAPTSLNIELAANTAARTNDRDASQRARQLRTFATKVRGSMSPQSTIWYSENGRCLFNFRDAICPRLTRASAAVVAAAGAAAAHVSPPNGDDGAIAVGAEEDSHAPLLGENMQVNLLTHSLAYSLAHSAFSLTHSLTHSLTISLARSLARLLARWSLDAQVDQTTGAALQQPPLARTLLPVDDDATATAMDVDAPPPPPPPPVAKRKAAACPYGCDCGAKAAAVARREAARHDRDALRARARCREDCIQQRWARHDPTVLTPMPL